MAVGSSGNTGYKAWLTLEEYDINTGLATGNYKPNDSGDPDYVAPVYDTTMCPLPTANDYTELVLMDYNPTPSGACSETDYFGTDGLVYHDGAGDYPNVGNYIYEGPNIGDPKMITQGDNWFKIEYTTKLIKVQDTTAQVISVADCNDSIDATPTSKSVPAAGETFTITVTSNTGWYIESTPSWITTSISGNNITTIVAQNTGAARNYFIPITTLGGVDTVNVLVSQLEAGGGGTTTS